MQVRDDEAAFDVALAVAADAELFRLESKVRWLELTESGLKREDLRCLGATIRQMGARDRRGA